VGVLVHGGAGRGCRGVGGSVPCRRVRRVRLGEAQVHGNVGRGLGALGGSVASDRRVRGASHDRPRPDLPRGIDPGVLGLAGGEVMEQEVVGGVLPRSGALGGHGDV
jgi:hypothetical protein